MLTHSIQIFNSVKNTHAANKRLMQVMFDGQQLKNHPQPISPGSAIDFQIRMMRPIGIYEVEKNIPPNSSRSSNWSISSYLVQTAYRLYRPVWSLEQNQFGQGAFADGMLRANNLSSRETEILVISQTTAEDCQIKYMDY